MNEKLTRNRGKWTEDEDVEEAMMEGYGNTVKGLISCWKGEDGYVDHVLREDLRAQVIKRSSRIHDSWDSEFISLKQIGMDHGATVEIARSKYSKVKAMKETNVKSITARHLSQH